MATEMAEKLPDLPTGIARREPGDLGVPDPQRAKAVTIRGLVPSTLEEAMTFATAMAKSTLIPKEFQGNPANTFIALQLGWEVGLSPAQSLQSIMVVNGRPCMWGDAVLGLVQASGKLEDFEEFINRDDPANPVAICRVKRMGRSKWHEQRFSKADAVKAGLVNKPGPWQNYFDRMLQMRARSWGLRDTMADVLRGIGVREEVEDIDITPTKVETLSAATVVENATTGYLADLPVDEQAEIRGLLEAAKLNKAETHALLKKHQNSPKGLVADSEGPPEPASGRSGAS